MKFRGVDLAILLVVMSLESFYVSAQLVIDEERSLTTRQTSPPSATTSPSNVPEEEVLVQNYPAQPRSEPNLSRQDNRRPIWALAHMVNSIKELDYRLEKGANAIEADVTFTWDGRPAYTYHGPPCDCWRHCHQQEVFADFLSYIRAVSIDAPGGIGRNLTMLFLDLKLDPLDQLAKERAGRELANLIMKHLYGSQQSDGAEADRHVRDSSFRLVLSVNHVHDIDLIRNFIRTLEINNSSHLLNENIGFDVGMNDDLQSIEAMWQKLGNNPRLNIWQGDGYTNCISPFYNLARLSDAIAMRDSVTGYPAKVYHWTIDLHDRMRESLLMGVDAIMTNHPERLITILREPMIAHDFRIASRGDNPFRKLTRRVLSRGSETARFQRSAYNPSSSILSNLLDVITSWWIYVKEIPLLSYPTILMSQPSHASLVLAKQRAASNNASTRAKTTDLIPNRLISSSTFYELN